MTRFLTPSDTLKNLRRLEQKWQWITYESLIVIFAPEVTLAGSNVMPKEIPVLLYSSLSTDLAGPPDGVAEGRSCPSIMSFSLFEVFCRSRLPPEAEG